MLGKVQVGVEDVGHPVGSDRRDGLRRRDEPPAYPSGPGAARRDVGQGVSDRLRVHGPEARALRVGFSVAFSILFLGAFLFAFIAPDGFAVLAGGRMTDARADRGALRGRRRRPRSGRRRLGAVRHVPDRARRLRGGTTHGGRSSTPGSCSSSGLPSASLPALPWVRGRTGAVPTSFDSVSPSHRMPPGGAEAWASTT